VCPTQQHIKEPGVEVAGASGVLAHTDRRTCCCSSDGRGTGLQVGHERLQQHLGHMWLDYDENTLKGCTDIHVSGVHFL